MWRALPPGGPGPPSCCRVRRGSFPAASGSGGDCPALILEPAILVPDEATSALDVTVQAQILALLQQLQQQLGLSYLFITHDLATVRRIADSVTVLRAGQVVEHGDVNRLFAAPAAGLHPAN